MNEARAVRELQAALHLRIDAVYDPTVARVRFIIERHAIRTAAGELVLSPSGALSALSELRHLFDLADARVEPILARGIAAAAELVGMPAPTPDNAWRAARSTAVAHLLRVRQALGDGRRKAMTQVQRVLFDAAASGRPVEEVITHLGQYADPWYAKRRDASGVLRRVTRTGARVSWPAAPGNAALPARHLMVSETVIAHGNESQARAIRRPGALIRWDLAPWHTEHDECDALSTQDVGFGPGLYDPRNVPERTHVGCVCLYIYVNPPGEME